MLRPACRSEALIGTFKAVGRKFGQWHDVAWFHKVLRDAPPS
jgi:L-amino acid N-acyltransferase YncA